jgi:hypothetical protein
MDKIDKIRKDLNIVFDYSKLDFNKPITRDDIDWDVYNNKFKFVDKVKSTCSSILRLVIRLVNQ